MASVVTGTPAHVSAELHGAVLERDGVCFVYRMDPKTHVCRDEWGVAHGPGEIGKLTVDHVHDGGGMLGKRAPSDLQHLVAMCASANVSGPSRAMREAERDYLASLYG